MNMTEPKQTQIGYSHEISDDGFWDINCPKHTDVAHK